MPFLVPLFATIGPFVLWPIEVLIPWSFFLEEIFKLFLVYSLFGISKRKLQIELAILSGVLFSLSESALYTLNIYTVSDLSTLFLRLIITTILHVSTILLILLFSFKDKRLALLGLMIAVIIHFLFNRLVA